MQNGPPLLYGIGQSQPPNHFTLIVWFNKKPIAMHFPMMPESYMKLNKYLVTITPTADGGWVDDFGAAPSPITISGTFGYKAKGNFLGKIYNGFGWMKFLEWMVDISHTTQLDGSLPEVWLMSHLSQHFYEVELIDMTPSQNVNRNMIWSYELKMTTLKPLDGISIVDLVFADVVLKAAGGGSTTLQDITKVSI